MPWQNVAADDAEEALLYSGDPADLIDAAGSLTERPWWHRRAACRGVGTDAFFLRRGQMATEAKALCAVCTVAGQCLAAALALPSHRDDHGVFGGLSPQERMRVRRNQNLAEAVGT